MEKELNIIIMWAVATLILGGVVGYYFGQSNQPFAKGYMQETAGMMRTGVYEHLLWCRLKLN